MSWTDIFPVFTDEQVAQFQSEATAEQRECLETWHGVAKTINPQTGKHIVAASLFWRNLHQGDPELPPITRKLMKNADKHGLVSRFPPWDHYVQPLLDGAARLKAARPDIVFRVYLAADLDFLVKDLLAAGCEVKLMHSGSIRHNPGALWRFLALEEEGAWVTITDADRAHEILDAVERTELVMKSGLGLWRIPYLFSMTKDDRNPSPYRPINAFQFGATGGHPVRLLLDAFVWHTLRETMPNLCRVPSSRKGKHQLPVYGAHWPSYGFDEWFLLAAMYPRFAFDGVLTFISINEPFHNHWFSLDIEYVTWANSKSEIFYYGHLRLLDEKRKSGKDASSTILKRLLGEKEDVAKPDVPLVKIKSLAPLTLVVARYNEDVSWLLKVPKDITIVLYNKGKTITTRSILNRIDHLIELPNQGRESDTYLCHLENYDHAPLDEWTVFCQGDPFPHSPRLLELLGQRDIWNDVQPLTSGYIDDNQMPPRIFRVLDTDEWVREIPVRTELCSAHTLAVVNYIDHGVVRIFDDYSRFWKLQRGWSCSGHFLEQCGLRKLAEKAWQASLIRMNFGAIFAVRNERLAEIPPKCLPKMRRLACSHYSHAYVFERLWLHLFGLPFIVSRGVENKAGRNQEQRMTTL